MSPHTNGHLTHARNEHHAEIHEPEGYFLMASRRPDLPIEQVAAEFELETNRDYLARSVKMRDERVGSG